MIDRLADQLGDGTGSTTALAPRPTKREVHTVVQQLKAEGLCGRRIAEERLGPYFLSSAEHGQREIELLDEVLEEEYEGSDFCIRTRRSECSRLRGGCKGSR